MKHKFKKFTKKILNFIAPYFLYFLSNFIHITCKKRYFVHQGFSSGNFIVAFWHGEILMIPTIYAHLKGQEIAKSKIIASMHNDGGIIAKYCALFGLEALRGSTGKGGIKVLANSIKLLREKYNIGICPDGPKGPYRSVADGIVAMSEKSSTPIAPFRVVSSRSYTLKSWDRFTIPMPFSTLDYYVLEPFTIPFGTDLASAKSLVARNMSDEAIQNYHKSLEVR